MTVPPGWAVVLQPHVAAQCLIQPWHNQVKMLPGEGGTSPEHLSPASSLQPLPQLLTLAGLS